MSEAAGIKILELRSRGCLNLRGDADDQTFLDAVSTAASVALPTEPCSWNSGFGSSAYWLGPDEWLLVVPDGEQPSVERRLREAVSAPLSVVDVGGGFVHVNLAGVDAGSVLQKSSPYDFHPRSFPPGRCVQTVFAQAGAMVAAAEDGSFDLVFRRSYADYLVNWITDAAEEYGLVVLGT
ncbi:MAG: sarcosine oxidase, gamma subunit family protein [Gammaproteobacteria bacterium]|nr:sarcosine oxidase, gamma subunit family protein [Gammaproteobacteria bacterium]